MYFFVFEFADLCSYFIPSAVECPLVHFSVHLYSLFGTLLYFVSIEVLTMFIRSSPMIGEHVYDINLNSLSGRLFISIRSFFLGICYISPSPHFV